MTLREVNSLDDGSSGGGGQSAHRPACNPRREILTRNIDQLSDGISDTGGGFHAPLIAGCQLDSRRGNRDVSRASELWAIWVVWSCCVCCDPTSSCKLVLTTSAECRPRRRRPSVARAVWPPRRPGTLYLSRQFQRHRLLRWFSSCVRLSSWIYVVVFSSVVFVDSWFPPL